MNTKQAKNFLVEQAAEQAALEGVPLADVEKRMMYFTESDVASCDNPIALNDEFEAQHETKEYETKISRLLHHAYTRLKEENPEGVRNWDQAIRTLRKGDHYILVMVDQSRESDVAWWVPILWGIGISILFFVLIVVENILDEKGLVPSWVFGWISSNRQTQRDQFYLILYGLVGLWVVIGLAKMGSSERSPKRFIPQYYRASLSYASRGALVARSRETGLSECGLRPVRARKPHSDKRTSQDLARLRV